MHRTLDISLCIIVALRRFVSLSRPLSVVNWKLIQLKVAKFSLLRKIVHSVFANKLTTMFMRSICTGQWTREQKMFALVRCMR
jgi:hypothetical protein